MLLATSAAVREGKKSELISEALFRKHGASTHFFTPLRHISFILSRIDWRQSSNAQRFGELGVNCKERSRHEVNLEQTSSKHSSYLKKLQPPRHGCCVQLLLVVTSASNIRSHSYCSVGSDPASSDTKIPLDVLVSISWGLHPNLVAKQVHIVLGFRFLSLFSTLLMPSMPEHPVHPWWLRLALNPHS